MIFLLFASLCFSFLDQSTAGRTSVVLRQKKTGLLSGTGIALDHFMKLFPLILLACSASAFGRIGETPNQCQDRYGSSTGQAGQFTMYSKGHVTVAVLFIDGISAKEIFNTEAGSQFSGDQISELLTANAEGSTWSKSLHNDYYTRSDGEARASLELGSNSVQSLTIWSITRKKIAEKESGSGF